MKVNNHASNNVNKYSDANTSYFKSLEMQNIHWFETSVNFSICSTLMRVIICYIYPCNIRLMHLRHNQWFKGVPCLVKCLIYNVTFQWNIFLLVHLSLLYIKNERSTRFCEGSTQIKPFIYHSYYYVQDIQLSSLQVSLLHSEKIIILYNFFHSLTFESLINIGWNTKVRL